MPYKIHLRVSCLAVTSVLMLPVVPTYAALDKFQPYVTTRVRHDTNLFRRSSNEEDETIAYLGGGVKTDLKLSRQHLLIDAEAETAKYDNFNKLDHTRLKGRAVWAWQIGNLWNGQLGTRYSRSLRSFNQTTIREKDMRTTKVGYFEAGYQIHPDWRLVGAVNYNTVDYQERTRLERDFSSGLFEVQYRNTLNTRVGIRAKRTDYNLQKTVVGSVKTNNDYKEDEISAVFYWEGSAKSKLEARLGYTKQSFNELKDRDYKGSTGRLTYRWIMTGKTKLDLSIWRETSSLRNEVTDYVLTKGISIKPVWSITRLVSLDGTFSYTNDDFKARNSLLSTLGGQRRDDDTYVARIYSTWKPRRQIDLSLGYSWERRDSSISGLDFKNKRVEAKAKYSFK